MRTIMFADIIEIYLWGFFYNSHTRNPSFWFMNIDKS
jgi:hypothetical protein